METPTFDAIQAENEQREMAIRQWLGKTTDSVERWAILGFLEQLEDHPDAKMRFVAQCAMFGLATASLRMYQAQEEQFRELEDEGL